MRAVFIKDLEIGLDLDLALDLDLTGPTSTDSSVPNSQLLLHHKDHAASFFHLVKVVRIREGESLLLLDGRGRKVFGAVKKIQKDFLEIDVDKIEKYSRDFEIDIAMGIVKKDAFSSCLKNAVELGVRTLYPLKTRFSQHQFELSPARTDALIESAIIQSNNPFALEVNPNQDFVQLMKGEKIDQYDLVLGLMEAKRGTSFTSSSLLSLPRESFAGRKTPRTLIVIGPEGGFSPEESQTLLELKNGRALHLPTPILRTQTALIASVGYILGHFH